jgi:hypothetical protein
VTTRNCKNAWHNETRRSQDAPVKRLTPASDGAGSRGGNVRSVSEARELQAKQKAKRYWAAAIDEQIRRTLIETGCFHADDLDPLGIPPEHSNLKGTRSAWFRNQGLMEKTGAERKVSHKAANGRKAPIHRITAKGRAKLVGTGAGASLARGASQGASSRSGEPAQSDTGVPNPQGPGGVASSPFGAGDGSSEAASGDSPWSPDASPEPLELLPPPNPEAWAA